ncbi:hypothetical protein ACFVXC_17705 [Streptomyces sp. NPDC058257]|uniref:hypothetical protein n=1 Tax=Streptomyces sp. NPDC058257 TaxID=3346409 RepID=UPI0036E3A6EF
MPQPSIEPTEADAFLAVCGHTHLFPGARCRIQGLPDPQAFATEPWPIELELRLSDDVVTQAELVTAKSTGPVLTVLSYTTGAGTVIDDRTWLIRELIRTGDEVELTAGGHLAA